jgi:hypothetical protein
MRHLLGRWAVDRYFTRGLGARAEATLRGHLSGCGPCSARYRRHLLAESLLPGAEALAGERLWRGILQAGAPVSARRIWVPLLLAGAAALFLLIPRPRPPAERGAGTGALAPPSIHLFRVEGPGRAAPVGERIARADALVLAYSNPTRVYDHLMVFGVDERYQVHWFYPPFLRPGDDPAAISIAQGRAGVELGEAINHDFVPGKLRVYALFLDRAERVSRIEAVVGATLAGPRAPLEREVLLPVAGHQQTRLLEVTP